MQRQRGELVPVAEALADLGGPVQAHGSFISPVTGSACCCWPCRSLGYGATLTSDATLADVLLAAMVLAVFGA